MSEIDDSDLAIVLAASASVLLADATCPDGAPDRMNALIPSLQRVSRSFHRNAALCYLSESPRSRFRAQRLYARNLLPSVVRGIKHAFDTAMLKDQEFKQRLMSCASLSKAYKAYRRVEDGDRSAAAVYGCRRALYAIKTCAEGWGDRQFITEVTRL